MHLLELSIPLLTVKINERQVRGRATCPDESGVRVGGESAILVDEELVWHVGARVDDDKVEVAVAWDATAEYARSACA